MENERRISHPRNRGSHMDFSLVFFCLEYLGGGKTSLSLKNERRISHVLKKSWGIPLVGFVYHRNTWAAARSLIKRDILYAVVELKVLLSGDDR